MIDQEFIKRATKLSEPIWDQYRELRRLRIDQWNRSNRELHRKLVKEYSQTEKGKYAISKSQYNRRRKFKSASKDLKWEEKILIGRFYKNCPEGYEVDHIMPISKGGKHRLSNLQYLTEKENRRKYNKIFYNESDYETLLW